MSGVTASSLLAEVRTLYGISFNETHTGGGCMALEAQLESGHWIVATNDGYSSLADRIAAEADEPDRPWGWYVAVFDRDAWHNSGEPSAWVADDTAFARELPKLVGEALRAAAAMVRGVPAGAG